MSRVINTNNPNKIRNHNRRTIAEMLQRLAKKPELDEEAKDMAATIVLCLREIHDTVETTIVAWEKRDYWMKAERFARDWEWTQKMAADLEDVIRADAWDLIPELLMTLYPHFSDIQIKTLTRKPIAWEHHYVFLMKQEPKTIWP